MITGTQAWARLNEVTKEVRETSILAHQCAARLTKLQVVLEDLQAVIASSLDEANREESTHYPDSLGL